MYVYVVSARKTNAKKLCYRNRCVHSCARHAQHAHVHFIHNLIIIVLLFLLLQGYHFRTYTLHDCAYYTNQLFIFITVLSSESITSTYYKVRAPLIPCLPFLSQLSYSFTCTKAKAKFIFIRSPFLFIRSILENHNATHTNALVDKIILHLFFADLLWASPFPSLYYDSYY